MPQMAPINWLSLFIYTVILMIIISSMLYFIFPIKPLKLLGKKTLTINWKW